jgi:hypothetical protein
MRAGLQAHPGLEQARQQIFEAHRRDPHFTGCAIGLRRRDGVQTDEPVVVAMVTKKLPAGALSRSRLLPQTVPAGGRNWGVDVVEVGPLALASRRGSATAGPDPKDAPSRGDAAARPRQEPLTGKFRPVVQGCIVSDLTGPDVFGATLGCLVRDLSDQTICILASNDVLAQNGAVALGEYVIQPDLADGGGPGDEVATLKRFIRYTTKHTNYVDAAIAQLLDGISYSQDVADSLMKPISADHPAVGMCLASDQQGLNCFLVPMESAVSALGVELLPATASSPCIVPAEVNMHIEKVGTESGYSSSTVVATAAQIKLLGLNDQVCTFANLIWTQAFQLPGDGGAVACQGGNGRTYVSPPTQPCPLLDAVGKYLNLPLTKDNDLTSEIKNQFLAQSLVGYLIIGLIYNNSQTVINRVKGKQAPAEDQAYAETYYKKYLPLAKAAIADPQSTKLVVTKGNLDDYEFILSGLSGALGAPALITPAETEALQTIYTDVLVQAKGMDFEQLVAYMNEVAVYEKVVSALAKVPTISLTGTLVDDAQPKGG